MAASKNTNIGTLNDFKEEFINEYGIDTITTLDNNKKNNLYFDLKSYHVS